MSLRNPLSHFRTVADDQNLDRRALDAGGRCRRRQRFRTATRAASLSRRSLSVSNWATRQDERRGSSARRLHISQ